MASASTPALESFSSRARPRQYRPRRRSNHDRTDISLPKRFQGINEEAEQDAARFAGDPFQERSLYGVIAQVGDLSKFTRRWQQGDESESEGEDNSSKDEPRVSQHSHGERPRPDSSTAATAPSSENRRHRKRLSETKLLKAFLKPSRPRRESESDDAMTQSQFLPPRETHVDVPPRPSSAEPQIDLPLLDRQLRAQARAEREARSQRKSIGDAQDKHRSLVKQKSLRSALAEIFSYAEPEEVLAEHPCWYMQNVLLQGYMYITKKHLSFYAYLQKKTGSVLKSGQLGKRGKQNPRYYRYYFVLKGHVLSYYSDATQPYFPTGTVDLRYAISAEIVSHKEDSVYFNIATTDRVYQLKADSLVSAQDWVSQLQTVIFRSSNEGDSLKISLPLEDVVDIEANPVVASADTLKLRVIDDDATFAVDEYFFHFPQGGKEALDLLTSLTEKHRSLRTSLHEDRGGAVLAKMPVRTVREPVHTTLSPLRQQPATGSLIANDLGAASLDQARHSVHEQSSCASSIRNEMSDDNAGDAEVIMSGSQILSTDNAFQATPLHTVRPLQTEDSTRQSSRIGTTSQSRLQSPQEEHDPLREATSRTAGLSGSSRASPDGSRPVRPAASTLQSAASLASYVRDQSKRMSSYLSASPREYYDRFSGAIAGGKRHYIEAEGLAPDDRYDDEDESEVAEHERRFRQHFAMPDTERLVAVFYASLHRVLPLYGKIYIGTHWFCYRSLLYGTRTKLIIPIRDIDNVEKQKGLRIGYPGLVLVLRGHEELFFDFRNKDLRDDCTVTILRKLDGAAALEDNALLTDEEFTQAQEAAAEHQMLQNVRTSEHPLPVGTQDDYEPASVIDLKPKQSLRIVCLTIGSRGDVQPYIALCKGLIAEGHRPKIATHVEFGDWVQKHGIDFFPVGGNPAELMRLCVELGMFTPKFIYETNYKFRGWLDELLQTAWTACKDADLLIESPAAMAGIHIAEALGIPYFRAFTMMWTRTRAYPHAFAAMNHKMGGTYNLTTYGIFENVFWQMTANQINKWRKKTLGIGPTSLSKLQQNKVPFLYNFSPSFVVPPLDFSDWVRITGYWFLDEGTDWTPPDDLVTFIQKARHDKAKLVYIGFGSVVVSDSKALTQSIVDAVVKADVRCILSKGWSDRFDAKLATEAEVAIPDSIFQIGAAPHDWLFKQVDAAVHHGGSGTTGASLRAGIPTIIKPFFGDQFFSASRVEDVGVGIRIKQISPNVLGKALWIATHDDRMRTKARLLGERIRAEDGVAVAIKALYRDLEYAKSLIKRKSNKPAAESADADDEEEQEESWTFVEAEGEFEHGMAL